MKGKIHLLCKSPIYTLCPYMTNYIHKVLSGVEISTWAATSK